MKPAREVRESEYMHWAKTRSRARFNLATSGLDNLPIDALDVRVSDLEITGPGGYGSEPLIDALAKRYRVESANVVLAAGTSFANHLAMATVLNPGDEALIESPGYEPILAVARYLGADVKFFERRFEDDFRLVPSEIEKRISPRTRLIVTTNLHNPSGVLTDEATLKQVGEIARNNNARVLVDEVYLEMLFQDPPPTAFHLGTEFIVTSSLTKAYGLSGLRCGWVFAEPGLAQRMWRLNDLYAASPVHAGERLSLLALQQLPGIAERSQRRLDENRQLLNDFLDSRKDLEAVRPRVGSIMFPRITTGDPEQLFAVLREKYETSVVPGRFFQMNNHFRIGLGVERDVLVEGLKRLGAALDQISDV